MPENVLLKLSLNSNQPSLIHSYVISLLGIPRRLHSSCTAGPIEPRRDNAQS